MLQGMDLRQTARCQREFSALEKSVPDNAHRKEPEKNGADAVEPKGEPWAGEPLGAGSGDPAEPKCTTKQTSTKSAESMTAWGR